MRAKVSGFAKERTFSFVAERLDRYQIVIKDLPSDMITKTLWPFRRAPARECCQREVFFTTLTEKSGSEGLIRVTSKMSETHHLVLGFGQGRLLFAMRAVWHHGANEKAIPQPSTLKGPSLHLVPIATISGGFYVFRVTRTGQ